MPSQQSSFNGTRTAFSFQVFIAATAAAPEGPSKIPQPWMQAYSVPDLLTPRSRTASPVPFTSWLPDTRTVANPGPAAESAARTSTRSTRRRTPPLKAGETTASSPSRAVALLEGRRRQGRGSRRLRRRHLLRAIALVGDAEEEPDHEGGQDRQCPIDEDGGDDLWLVAAEADERGREAELHHAQASGRNGDGAEEPGERPCGKGLDDAHLSTRDVEHSQGDE